MFPLKSLPWPFSATAFGGWLDAGLPWTAFSALEARRETEPAGQGTHWAEMVYVYV